MRIAPVLFLSTLIGCATTAQRSAPDPPASGSPVAPGIVPAPEPSAPVDPVATPGAVPLGAGSPELRASAPPPEDGLDPEQLLSESTSSLSAADAAWSEGRFDDALAALDRAYVRMAAAAVDTGALARERDDLRRLIARRVLELVTSRAAGASGESRSSIPLESNVWIEKELERFRGSERTWFLASVERSGVYRPEIVERLREAGLPEELSWLPLVESGFQARALSSARALGLWQFIASTGTRYGLDRTRWVDERMDPTASTGAAIAYLTDLHGIFGDWLTALAAYNCGETRVRRVLERQSVAHLDRFWDVYEELPRETRRYVPRFLATVLVMRDPEAHGFPELPTPASPPATAEVAVDRSVRLADLDTALELPKGTLVRLNPELRHDTTPEEEYSLRVPVGVRDRVGERLAALPEHRAPDTDVHRVRRGETLSTIAARYGTSVRTLMRLNGIRNPHRIRPGQRLQVELGRSVRTGGGSLRGVEVVTVRRGDSLWSLARRSGTTVAELRRLNDLSSDRLQPGQRIRVRRAAGSNEAGSEAHRVSRGDTLAEIAARYRVRLGDLLAANGLRRSSTIYPGQTLTIPR